ncbi:MAG: NAD(P)H-binding protein [Myxococcales bacterium]|nr:NAD(P)H-binding protein [Myxococcales bacterium]
MFTIAGATGNTGAVVATTLLAAKAPVRVIVRDAAKATAWRERGAEIAVADVSDLASLTAALRGSKGAYLLVPPRPSSLQPLGGQPRGRRCDGRGGEGRRGAARGALVLHRRAATGRHRADPLGPLRRGRAGQGQRADRRPRRVLHGELDGRAGRAGAGHLAHVPAGQPGHPHGGHQGHRPGLGQRAARRPARADPHRAVGPAELQLRRCRRGGGRAARQAWLHRRRGGAARGRGPHLHQLRRLRALRGAVPRDVRRDPRRPRGLGRRRSPGGPRHGADRRRPAASAQALTCATLSRSSRQRDAALAAIAVPHHPSRRFALSTFFPPALLCYLSTLPRAVRERRT